MSEPRITSDAPDACPDCGALWTSMESVITGDDKAFEGWEDWCYCRNCSTETFYPHYIDRSSHD